MRYRSSYSRSLRPQSVRRLPRGPCRETPRLPPSANGTTARSSDWTSPSAAGDGGLPQRRGTGRARSEAAPASRGVRIARASATSLRAGHLRHRRTARLDTRPVSGAERKRMPERPLGGVRSRIALHALAPLVRSGHVWLWTEPGPSLWSRFWPKTSLKRLCGLVRAAFLAARSRGLK